MLGASLSAQPASRPADTLTIEETVGSAFLAVDIETREQADQFTAIFRRANPAAKPVLYKMLTQSPTAERDHTIVTILGYIGDGQDAVRLEQHVLHDFSGELKDRKTMPVRGVFNSLARMSRRGVKEAADILGRMCDLGYWQQINFTWPGEGRTFKHSTAHELTAWAVVAYAKSNQPDWKARVDAYARTLQDPDLQREMVWAVHVEGMQRGAKEEQEADQRPTVAIKPELRALLPKLFNGDLENPAPARPDSRQSSAPNVSEKGFSPGPLSPASSALVKEGFAEYKAFAAAFTSGDYESVLDRFISDGEPKSVKRMKSQWKELKSALDLERKLLQLPAVRDAKCVDWALTQSETDRFESLTPEGSPVEPRARIQTILTFKLEGTKGLFAEIVGPGDRNTNTFAPDGSLLVLMMKIDGKWYWNPFGF